MTRRQRQIQMLLYVLCDYIAAMLAWGLFFAYRKRIEGVPISAAVLSDEKFILGILLIPGVRQRNTAHRSIREGYDRDLGQGAVR